MKVFTNKSVTNERGEVWVPIPMHEGVYEISNHGRIKRVKGFRAVNDRILTWNWHRGYLMITLSKNNIHNRIMVHIAVAKEFVPNPNNYPQVGHIDNNPSNPHYKNLKWCTQSINIRDAYSQGRKGRLTVKQVKDIRKQLKKGTRVCDLCVQYSANRSVIMDIRNGKTWSFIK